MDLKGFEQHSFHLYVNIMCANESIKKAKGRKKERYIKRRREDLAEYKELVILCNVDSFIKIDRNQSFKDKVNA